MSTNNRKGARLNLDTLKVDIEDSDPQSKYFDVVEFKPKLNGGKNSITMNGSELLKKGSKIQIEVLDLKKNPLYIEVARSPIGGIKYRDGVSTVIAVHVQGSTPVGVGEVIVVGETSSGKKVRWRRKVTIDSKITNADRVRFYKQPELIVEPITSKLAVFDTTPTITKTGTASTLAVSPIEGSNFVTFDVIRNRVVYKVFSDSPDFNSLMEGETIKFTNIVLEEGQSPLTITKEFVILDVLNSNEILLKSPFIYPDNFASIKPVENMYSADWSVSYTPRSNSSTVTDVDDNPLLSSLCRVTVKNIRPFTGNVSRIKIFRKSFQSNSDNELVTDALVDSREILIDDDTPNRQRENLGYFIDQSLVDTYWHTTTGSLIQTSGSLIDGMFLSGSYNGFPDYVIVKDDTATSPDSPGYLPATTESIVSQSGANWDSNFLGLFGGVDYTLSARIHNNRLNDDVESKIQFYLTGSMLGFSSSLNYDENGVKIGEEIFPIGVNDTFHEFSNDFSINHDANCTLIIVPFTDGYTISELSIKPKQAFSFSPDIFTMKFPFPVSKENERYRVRCELFDIDNNYIPVNLEKITFFDPEGKTLRFESSSVVNLGNSILPSWASSFPNLSGYNITADSFIGDLTGNADTATSVSAGGTSGLPITFSISGNDVLVTYGSTTITLSGSI